VAGKSAEGFTVVSDGESYTAKKLLICTGSDAAVPPIPGLKESVASGFAVTNREILDLTKAPSHLAVIGGGVIGLEMASYFNSIGCKVTVVEMMDKIAGPTDKDISALLQKNYTKKGVEFILGAKVTGVSGKDGSGYIEYEKD
jgi:dihydrolipoamide dehydrogenase